jgi:hypothetical protein
MNFPKPDRIPYPTTQPGQMSRDPEFVEYTIREWLNDPTEENFRTMYITIATSFRQGVSISTDSYNTIVENIYNNTFKRTSEYSSVQRERREERRAQNRARPVHGH